MSDNCVHGYGGFFKCPQGCHTKGPILDQDRLDSNIDYVFERMKAHGMSVGFEEPKRKV